jgi:hypothetical protein
VTRSYLLAAFVLGAAALGAPETPTSNGLKLATPIIPAEVTGALRSINEAMSKDLAPADNAVVDLVQLFGTQTFERELRRDSLAMLGIDRLATSGPEFLYLEPYVIAQGAIGPDQQRTALGTLGEELHLALERPWKKAELPELFEYLAANDRALNAVIAASKRPRYYAPLLSIEEPPRLLSASLVIERRLQFLSQCLSARALRHVAEKNLSAARENLLACHRLAVLLAVGSPFDVSGAKGDVVDAIAFRATLAVLESGELNGDQARLWLNEFNAIPRMPSPSRAADLGERAILHQEIEFLKSDEESVEGFLEVPAVKDQDALKAVNLKDLPWDLAVKRGDEIQDKIVQALAVRERDPQVRLFEQLDREYAAWEESSPTGFEKLAGTIETDPVAAARFIGEEMAWSLKPNYWQRRHSEDRTRVRRDLIALSLALTIHRHERGGYPATLSELVPRYLPTIPRDAHSDALFHYVRSDADHARLTCWGANRRDDAGQEYNDDLSIGLR